MKTLRPQWGAKVKHKLKNEKERVWFKRMVSNLLSLKTKQNQTLCDKPVLNCRAPGQGWPLSEHSLPYYGYLMGTLGGLLKIKCVKRMSRYLLLIWKKIALQNIHSNIKLWGLRVKFKKKKKEKSKLNKTVKTTGGGFLGCIERETLSYCVTPPTGLVRKRLLASRCKHQSVCLEKAGSFSVSGNSTVRCWNLLVSLRPRRVAQTRYN